VDIHATVFVESGKSAVVPKFVTNHGILSGPDLHQLLQQSKVASLWSLCAVGQTIIFSSCRLLLFFFLIFLA